MAPELLKLESDISKEADMYAFGMVIFEVRAHHGISIVYFVHHRYKVFAGAAPFADSPPTTVAVRVLSGKRPDRPKNPGLTDELWDLIQRCWEGDPLRRPESSEVVSHLRLASIVQPDRSNMLGVTVEDWTALGGILRKVSRRLRGVPSAITGRFRLTRFGDAHHIISLPVSEDICSIGTNGSETSLRDMKLGESDEPVGVQIAPSGPCGLFRRPAFWNSRRGTSSARDWNDRCGNLTDKV